MIGDFLGDQRGIQGHVIGAVMAVTAGALGMPHGDRLDRPPEHVGQRCAADRRPGVGPDRQVPVAAFRQRAGRRDRGVRDIAAGIRCLEHLPGDVAPADRRAAGRRSAGRPARRLPAVPVPGARTPSHVACSGAATAARCAMVSSGPISATKSPSRRMRSSPGAARRTAASSSVASRAPRDGWRSSRACSMSGRTMSCMKAAPTSLAGRSSRGAGRPTT